MIDTKKKISELLVTVNHVITESEKSQIESFLHLNETKLAAEILCEYLSEYQTKESYTKELKEICQELNVNSIYWSHF